MLKPALKGIQSRLDYSQHGGYGVLGSFYAHEILDYDQPRVGLLNNGTEEDKGDQVHKEAHQLLRYGSDKNLLNFVGNVEARDVLQGGDADAVFSAGNTGALLAAGIFIVGRIKGIDRPALMTALPAFDGPHDAFVMMDMGANAENRPAHLYQLARDQMPDTEFLLFGQLDKVKPFVKNEERLTLVQADEVIAMADEPVKSIRRKKQSSLVLAAQAVKNRDIVILIKKDTPFTFTHS
ncbi:hypothetical protein H7R52_12750 [Weissella confusa]|uniref:phosphate acyltransferase n=1 Tax=Weissella confusa TaxID=1583 RepID=A0A923NEZ8_WEICO|nr:hypothetical protein [Weissella confusa]